MGPFELLQKVAEAFEKLHIPYLVTGSVASMAYGEPRLTNDIDIVAAIEVRHVSGLVKAFPEDEFFVTEAVVVFAWDSDGAADITLENSTRTALKEADLKPRDYEIAKQKMLEAGFNPRSIINRAYYSIFYMLLALFLKTDVNIKTSKHN
jgi:hypothetical protein